MKRKSDSPSKRGPNREGSVKSGVSTPVHYRAENMRAIWNFVRSDFDRFLETLAWLDTLSAKDGEQQLESARWLAEKHRLESARWLADLRRAPAGPLKPKSSQD